MCIALKTLVFVASVFALTVATNDRERRSEYGSLNSSPWQSPTSYGFRPNNNYYDLPSTKLSRINPYGTQDNQLRNSGQDSNLYSIREQNSDWIPILPNQNQQNAVRYGQNQIQQQRANQYNTVRYNNELLNDRNRQRQPNYSVEIRYEPVNAEILREINNKLLVQSNPQHLVYRNGNQGPRDYLNQANRGTNQINSVRLNRVPLSLNGPSLVKNIQGLNPRYPVQHPIDQQSLNHLLRIQHLPPIEGRILGLNVQEVKPVQEVNQNDANVALQNLRVANVGHLVGTNQLPVVQGRILGDIVQRPEGYAVQEISEAEQILNEQKLRELNEKRQREIQANREALNVQDINEPSAQLKQNLRELNSDNLVRSEELQEPNNEYLRSYIQVNNPSTYLAQRLTPSGNNQGYLDTSASINSNRDSAVLDEQNAHTLGQQALQRNVPTSQVIKLVNGEDVLNNNNIRLSPLSSRGYGSELLVRSNQGLNSAWEQNEQLENLRNTQRLNLEDLGVGQAQQNEVQDGGNQRPNVYTYAELTAKIWKIIKSNPAMMSDLDSLREQVLNERNSRNAQIRELRGLLEQARKYNRNSALNLNGQTLEQQKQDDFLSDLIDTMNRNEASSNSEELRRQLSYLGETGQRQARYLVRPKDVNPLIKNILFETSGRKEPQTNDAATARQAPIIVRPNTSQPLPQLSVGKTFGLEQLEHHYDLTHWKQVTEALGGGNPFLQDYNVLEHLV